MAKTYAAACQLHSCAGRWREHVFASEVTSRDAVHPRFMLVVLE